MKRVVALIMVVFAVVAAASTSSFEKIGRKAERFVKDEEWSSAEAMYQLMIDERPDSASLWADAIVMAGMRNDSIAQMNYLDNAINHHIAFDSIFSNVMKFSFSLGRANVYEKFMDDAIKNNRWLSRNIDSYLAHYYYFRRNPSKMIEYGSKILEGLPDNVEYMEIVAQGYILKGDISHAMGIYNLILKINPDNYKALLYVGLYLAHNGTLAIDRTTAIDCLQRALLIHPTPYVEKELKNIL